DAARHPQNLTMAHSLTNFVKQRDSGFRFQHVEGAQHAAATARVKEHQSVVQSRAAWEAKNGRGVQIEPKNNQPVQPKGVPPRWEMQNRTVKAPPPKSQQVAPPPHPQQPRHVPADVAPPKAPARPLPHPADVLNRKELPKAKEPQPLPKVSPPHP